MVFAMEGDIGEGAVPWWNAWGRRFIIVWGDDINDKKKKIYYVMALNGYQTGDKGCNNQQKTSAFNGGGMEHDVRAAGSMGGARFDRFHGDHVK